MRKLFFTLVVLFLIYFGIQAVFYFFGPGHDIEYEINGYTIKENYTNHQKNEFQNYFFEITKNDLKFNVQIFENYDNKNKILIEVKEYNSESINCILPIFIDNKVLTDLICVKDNITYNYQSLKGENVALDAYYKEVSGLISNMVENSIDTKGTIVLYGNSIPHNYYLSFVTYKGYISTSSTKKTLESKNIFTKDVYDNYLSAYVNEYYITVNYDDQYNYSYIYVYNIVNGDENKITLTANIDKNSYIQGIADNKLYIFDIDNKKQYEVNPETLKVLEVGNVTTGVKLYNNGTWTRASAYDCASEHLLFQNVQNNVGDYQYLTGVGGSNSGYTYYYQKNGEKYKIFRVNNQQKENYTYLFDVKYIDKIIALNEYVFFADDYYIKYYSDSLGIHNLISNTELYFNQNLEFQIVYKK